MYVWIFPWWFSDLPTAEKLPTMLQIFDIMIYMVIHVNDSEVLNM